MATLNFNANDVAPSVGFEPLPEGKYVAVITESSMEPTKNADGEYLALTFQIIEGQYSSRNLWTRLNLRNRSEKAVQIAQAELSAICRAVGVMEPKDSNDLHGIPLTITVKLRKRQDNGELANEIKGYEKQGAAVKVAAAPANGGNTAPWARKA